ncbi:cysteine hydrolase family protein [Nocardia sp. MW-W600-9]
MNILILIDLINEMVDPRGKLASKGYAEFARSAGVPDAVDAWRRSNDVDRVIHVGLEFRTDYADAARKSLLLGKAPEFGVAKHGEFGAEFVDWAAPKNDDIVIRKQRISAFFGTDLDVVLRSLGATTVTIGGVATDLAVSSAARDAHDRDYEVRVAQSVCVAATKEDHQAALQHIAKFATIV